MSSAQMRVWSYHHPPGCQRKNSCCLHLRSITNWQRGSRENHLPKVQTISLWEITRTDCLGGRTKYSGKRLDVFFQKPPGFLLPNTEQRISKQFMEVMFYNSKTILAIPILLYKNGESSLLNQPGQNHFPFQGQIPAVHCCTNMKDLWFGSSSKPSLFPKSKHHFGKLF